MAKRLEFDIVTDPSKGIAGLKQFAGAAKKAMGDVNNSLDDTTTSAQKVAKALSGLAGDIETEMKGAAQAADALGKALGPEIAGRANLDQVVADLKKMGLTFDEITADADALAAGLKDLDRVQVQAKGLGEVESSAKRAKGGIDEVGKSADSSKSALANMIGNSAQDLGAMGGAAGSAGVAIGQMAEYMADAALEGETLTAVMANFARVALPILAIAAAVSTVQGVMGAVKKDEKEATKITEELGAAFQQTGDWVQAGTKVLQEHTAQWENYTNRVTNFGEAINQSIIGKGLSQLPVIGDHFKKVTTDVVAGLAKVGLGVDDVNKSAEGNVIFNREFEQALLDGVKTGKLTEREYKDITDAAHGYQIEVKAAKDEQAKFNLTAGKTHDTLQAIEFATHPLEHFTDLWGQLVRAIKSGNDEAAASIANALASLLHIADPAAVLALAYGKIGDEANAASQQLDDNIKVIEEWRDATLKAAGDVSGAVGDMTQQWKAMADQVSEKSFKEALDQFDALSQLDLAQMRQDTVKSFDDVKAAIKTAAKEVKGWGKMDLTPDSFEELKGMPDAFGGVTDAVSGMRGRIQTELQAAFDTGGIQVFSDKFDFFAGQVREQFTTMFEGMGLPEDQVQAQVDAILADLGLLPKSKEVIIKLTRDQEAKNALDLFMSDIATIEQAHPSVDIRAKMAAGDIAGAIDELNALRITQGADPIVLPSDVDRVGAEQAAADARIRAQVVIDQDPLKYSSEVLGPDAKKAVSDAQTAIDKLPPLQIPVRIGTSDQFALLRGLKIQDAGGTTGAGGGIVAERRPEIINGRYLALTPTVVPPGTRVTSGARTAHILRTRGTRGLKRYDSGGVVTPVTINPTFNINAGAIADPFAFMNIVNDANRKIQRLLPRHP